MKLSENAVIYINDFFEYNCFEAYVYENYSGRCMFGSTTDGIVADSQRALTELTKTATEDEFEEVVNFVTSLNRRDSMGLSVIYY